jgi:hypothetical protein
VENFSYTYDVLGNVLTRADANENLTETFTGACPRSRLSATRGNNLNRVTSATMSQSVAPVKTFTYDALGNLLSKSDVGNYTNPLTGSALPHAVTKAWNRYPYARANSLRRSCSFPAPSPQGFIPTHRILRVGPVLKPSTRRHFEKRPCKIPCGQGTTLRMRVLQIKDVG